MGGEGLDFIPGSIWRMAGEKSSKTGGNRIKPGFPVVNGIPPYIGGGFLANNRTKERVFPKKSILSTVFNRLSTVSAR
jgi:hypothetical protein